MNTLKRSREAILYTGLALLVALGATACGDDVEDSNNDTPTATTEPSLIATDEEGYGTNFELSDQWTVVDVQYLGQTEFFERSDLQETYQFVVTYEGPDGKPLVCLKEVFDDNRAGGSTDCNWEAYNQAS